MPSLEKAVGDFLGDFVVELFFEFVQGCGTIGCVSIEAQRRMRLRVSVLALAAFGLVYVFSHHGDGSVIASSMIGFVALIESLFSLVDVCKEFRDLRTTAIVGLCVSTSVVVMTTMFVTRVLSATQG